MCPLQPFFSETTRPKSMKFCMVLSHVCLQVLKPFWYPYLPPLAHSRPKTAIRGMSLCPTKMSLCPTRLSLCPTNVLMSDKNVLMSNKNVLMSDKNGLMSKNCLYVRQNVPWSHRRQATKAEGCQVASSRNFHTVTLWPHSHSVEKREILSHSRKISSNQLFL